MKKNILVFCLLNLVRFVGFSQTEKPAFISKDSIQSYYIFPGKWKFKEGDNINMSLPQFNDSSWIETESYLNLNRTTTPRFNGTGWFRKHFVTDSTITGRPLAMTMNHLGASEIYLDGNLIQSFGKIGNIADSCFYYDPQGLPFVFLIKYPGEHVLAIRYANYNSEKNYEVYGRNTAGFHLKIGESANLIDHKDTSITIFSFVMMILCGFFVAFCLIHFFLYLLNKEIKSNLYFSIFILSIAICFIIGFISYASHSPSLELKSIYLLNSILIIASVSLSGFINELFGKEKLRFKIILCCGLLFMIARFMNMSIYPVLTIVLGVGVSFEAVFTVVFAIIKKVKGAWIIGTGILFFTLFIIIVFTTAITTENQLDIDDSTTGGKLFLLVTILSIISIPISMSVYLAWNFSSINKNLSLQLAQVNLLSAKTLEHEQEKQRMLESRKEELEKEVWERTSELRAEKKKSDDLLLNILPEEVAEELKEKGSAAAKEFEQVTVLFTDFKGFTEISEKLSPAQLVSEINYCFSAFDNIIHKYGIEKIKTIGDSYMCAGGLPAINSTNPEDVVKASIEICQFMNAYKKEKEDKGQLPFEIRIGVHTGPVVAGIVGVKKFAYDIWGDTVNTASRMESSGAVGKVNISGATYEFVKDQFRCEFRGKIQAKGKGEIDMYFVS